jgi:hypothetical protein
MASDLDRTPSFRKTDATWLATVRTELRLAAAIWALERPSSMASVTARSAALSDCGMPNGVSGKLKTATSSPPMFVRATRRPNGTSVEDDILDCTPETIARPPLKLIGYTLGLAVSSASERSPSGIGTTGRVTAVPERPARRLGTSL